MDEGDFFVLWAAVCLFSGIAFLLIGGHAAGLALLGALLGAPVGFALVSFDLDAAPLGLTTGATIGALLAGLAGLAWKPRASRSVLMAFGVIVVLAGIGGAIYVVAGGYGALACRSYRAGCFPHVDGWTIALFALDAAWVTFLCFFQATGDESRPTTSSRRPNASVVGAVRADVAAPFFRVSISAACVTRDRSRA